MGKIIRNGLDYSGLINANGVFIDTKKLIKGSTSFRTSMSYTATEDCVFVSYLLSNGDIDIKVDDNFVGGAYANSTTGFPFTCFLKRGQTIKATGINASYDSSYRVYGVLASSNPPVVNEGIFIDTNNVIQSLVTFTGETSYTATEDCVVNGSVSTTSGKTAYINIDGVTVFSHYSQSGEQSIYQIFYLKQGQTILFHNETDWVNINGYVVYGVQQSSAVHSNYSTTEHKTGRKWIDGKDIYEKTISLDNVTLSSTSYGVDVSSLSLDTLIEASLIAVESGVEYLNIWRIQLASNKQSLSIFCMVSNFSVVGNHKLTLTYTKS